MKKLDKFILTSFIGPFFGILAVVIFIFMMQVLWLYIDELVGKGLTLKVVLEFLFWGCSTMLPICLPLATLLASVMTVGQMGENNELIAMKSAGISLGRVFVPLTIAATVITVAAFYVSNDLVPIAYNKIYTMRDDFGRTKEEINIPTGTFYNGIDGYVLRVSSKNKKTGMMEGVMVYDHTGNKGNTSVTLADSAMMKMSKNKDYLIFDLYSGINYQETNDMRGRDTTLQMQQIKFDKQEMIISLENYAFKKSGEDRFGNSVKAMNIKHLLHAKDSISTRRDSVKRIQMGVLRKTGYLNYNNQIDTSKHFTASAEMQYDGYKFPNIQKEIDALNASVTECRELINVVSNFRFETDYEVSVIRKADVELLRKFAQAFLCLIMFFIGAPLGAFIRKGGLGASAIIAVLFFVLYWVVDITGTKLARDGAVSAAAGVYISTIVMLPIGIFLTVKAIQDATLFNFDNFKNWWRRIKSNIMQMFRKTRIVYMGTPEFAVAPLEGLVNAKYNVVGVVTVADKPSGRGLKVNESAVKKYAVEHNIPVLQPLKLKDPEFLAQLAALKADLFVVVAFRMLPEEVWSMPPLGTFNLHAALLPQYRGAAPINWAIINGEKMSGVTTFMIDKNIDTGGIILRQECRIAPTDTAGDLHDKLMPIGTELVLQTVEGLIEKNVETRVQRSFIQGSEVLHPAPKLSRELCHIDWNDTTNNINNLIRGLSPYPTAFTEIVREGKEPQQLKIFKAEPLENAPKAAPGTLLTDNKTYLAFATEDGAISIKDLQISGKKRMDVAAFLAGFRDAEAYKATQGTSKAEIAKTKQA